MNPTVEKIVESLWHLLKPILLTEGKKVLLEVLAELTKTVEAHESTPAV